MSAVVFARVRPLITLHAGVPESDVAGGAGRRPRPLSSRPPLRMSPLQPVERNFAFVVNAEVPAAWIVAAAKAADPALISDVQVFDVFAGESLGPGRKSLAIAVTIQPTERTRIEADLEALSTRIAQFVESATGGTVRA